MTTLCNCSQMDAFALLSHVVMSFMSVFVMAVSSSAAKVTTIFVVANIILINYVARVHCRVAFPQCIVCFTVFDVVIISINVVVPVVLCRFV